MLRVVVSSMQIAADFLNAITHTSVLAVGSVAMSLIRRTPTAKKPRLTHVVLGH